MAAARDCGLKTVFVRRPLEYGPNRAGPPQPSQDWELSVDGLIELAAALGL
jgi:2-haloacid dehalogenase